MYSNNNFPNQINPHQQLQQEIHALNNQFANWKRIVSQFPPSSQFQASANSPSHPILPQINYKVDHIYNIILDFCRKFDRQLMLLKEKQASFSNFNRSRNGPTDIRVPYQQDKIQAVNEKISILEDNLKRTQQNQKKLVETLNIMMKKYQCQSDKSRSINEDYYATKNINSQQKSGTTLFPLNLCSKFKREEESIKKQNQNTRFTKKTEHNSQYILADNSYTLDYSTQSQAVSVPEGHMRMFCTSDNNKKSLKQFPNHPGAIYRVEDQRPSRYTNSDVIHSSRHVSLDRHGHRLRFMMENLNQ